ncbi:unnamed protein product [Sphagnum balticum]
MRWTYSVSNRFIPLRINCLRFSVSQCSRLQALFVSSSTHHLTFAAATAQLTSELCICFGRSDFQLRFRGVVKLKFAAVALGIETNLA